MDGAKEQMDGPSAPVVAHELVERARVPIAAAVEPISRLELESVEVDATVRAPLDLREPLNVVIRGLLGARLRDLRCLTRAPTCEGCDVRARCDYIRIFETPADLAPGAHGSHGPHPFWLRGLPATRSVPVGSKLTARIVTVGFARPLLPYLDVALRDAWMRLSGGSIELSGSRVVRERFPVLAGEKRAWTLHAVTPLVLNGDPARAREDCPAAPWLSLLVRAGVRRVRSLLAAYGNEAEKVTVVFPDLRDVAVVDGGWSVWRSSRFSARQGQRVPLGGWVGRATVRGEAMAEIAPLLSALTVVSVGKTTTMGFGELRVEEAGVDES